METWPQVTWLSRHVTPSTCPDLAGLWPPPPRAGQTAHLLKGSHGVFTLYFKLRPTKLGCGWWPQVEISGMWLAPWSVNCLVPKGKGTDRDLFKYLQQARQISPPPIQLSHWGKGAALMPKIPLALLSQPSSSFPRINFDPSKSSGLGTPLGYQRSSRYLRAKRMSTWEGDTSKVKNSREESVQIPLLGRNYT